jgi:hypothetical protein
VLAPLARSPAAPRDRAGAPCAVTREGVAGAAVCSREAGREGAAPGRDRSASLGGREGTVGGRTREGDHVWEGET